MSRALFMVSLHISGAGRRWPQVTSNHRIVRNFFMTHNPSYRLITAFWKLRSRTVSKSFADFRKKLLYVSAVDYTLYAAPGRSHVACLSGPSAVFPAVRERGNDKELPLIATWRRGWDSNPHTLMDYYWFSKPVPYQLGLPLQRFFNETHCVKEKFDFCKIAVSASCFGYITR